MTEPVQPAARRVAHPVLDGHRRIDALWFPHEWLDEHARRRLLVAAWQAGSRAYRFADGDLLCFAQAVAADCDAVPGWPLQRVAGTLCSAAIEPADLAGRAFADAWIAAGGALRPLRLADAAALDPSLWLAVDAAFVDTFELQVGAMQHPLVAPTARELRAVLGPDVPAAASTESLQFLRALQQRGKAGAATARPAPGSMGRGVRRFAIACAAVVAIAVLIWPSGPAATPAATGTTSLHDLVTALAGAGIVLLLVLHLLRGRSGGTGESAPGGRIGADAGAPARAAAAGIRARFAKTLPQRWRDWAARAAMTSGLARLLGAQHAAYLRRMLAMFDDGKLEDALRHAVPLGGDDGQTLGQAFGRLGPRADLSLGARRGAGTAVDFGGAVVEHLRTIYRRAFARLDAAGRIDEATFVLAELLHARQEALDYLEKHGRFEQAAELAFGWDMPGVQIVRLNALAGRWRLAVQVALRDNAFAGAVTLLEKRWPEAGARLRREWADVLVAQGRWLAAVQAIWPLPGERGRAGAWLQIVEDAGGTLAARALALRAQCLPGTLASRAALIEALRDDPALGAERAALVHELLLAAAPIDAAARRLAALVLGAAIADQAGPQATLAAKALQSLATFAGDATLSADLPDARQPWPAAPAQPLVANAGRLEWQAPPAGLQAILDAVPLADGEFLVALGEAGALRLDARGRRLAHFDVPAHRLVVSPDGLAALAVAARERVWRVTRLELARGAAVDLGLHAFDAFADGFDGIGWTVGNARRVQVLDTTAGLRDALWQVDDLPGRVVFISSAGDTELLVLQDEHEGRPRMEVWDYQLPGRRLRARDPIPTPDDGADVRVARVVVEQVGLVDLVFDLKRPGVMGVRPSTVPGKPWADLPDPGPSFTLQGAAGLIALRSDTRTATRGAQAPDDEPIRIHDFATGQLRATVHWPAEADVQIRVVGATWLVFDREGRLAAIDADTGVFRALSLR